MRARAQKIAPWWNKFIQNIEVMREDKGATDEVDEGRMSHCARMSVDGETRGH